MKIYTIRRNGKVSCKWWDDTSDVDLWRPLPHLMRHSPDGFEYGYGGSGPSDLARSIVGHVYDTAEPEPWKYQKFKWKIIAELHGDGPHIVTEALVRGICHAAE